MNAPAGGLRVPAVLGIDSSAQRDIHNEWDTLSGVKAMLVRDGFTDCPQPNFACPSVTEEDLTTTDNTKYSQNYARLLAWFNYASQLLAEVNAALLGIENEMEYVGAKMKKDMRENNRGKGLKDASRLAAGDIADEILLDPHYHELQVEQQRLTQMKYTLTSRVDNLERGLRVTSRQVEIRKLELERGRVGDGVPTRDRFPVTRR